MANEKFFLSNKKRPHQGSDYLTRVMSFTHLLSVNYHTLFTVGAIEFSCLDGAIELFGKYLGLGAIKVA